MDGPYRHAVAEDILNAGNQETKGDTRLSAGYDSVDMTLENGRLYLIIVKVPGSPCGLL